MSRTGLLCLGIFFLAVAAGEGQSPTPSPRDVAPPTAVSADQSGTEAETERIIVTGSNIPTAEEVGPNPVQTIDRAFIEKSGERTAEQLLRNLPVAGPQGVPSFNGQNFFAPGASSISLRGFDPSDTLVLIDGRRVATTRKGRAAPARKALSISTRSRKRRSRVSRFLKTALPQPTARTPSPAWSI